MKSPDIWLIIELNNLPPVRWLCRVRTVSGLFLPKIKKGATTHAKEKTTTDHWECNAELERTQKLLQKYENRNKMLNRKLSAEKRKERNHRIFLFGGFMESIVPELKTMTEDEGKDFLYHIAKSTEAQEYLKKQAEGVGAG